MAEVVVVLFKVKCVKVGLQKILTVLGQAKTQFHHPEMGNKKTALVIYRSKKPGISFTNTTQLVAGFLCYLRFVRQLMSINWGVSVKTSVVAR
jgi:hypothetical protein